MQLKMKLIAGVTSLRSFRQKWNFLSDDKCYVNTTPKWNYTKRNVCTSEYLIKTKDSRSKDQDKSQFHFISGAMKANVNIFFFHGKTKFRLGYISFRISCKDLHKLHVFNWEILFSYTCDAIFFVTYEHTKYEYRTVLLHQCWCNHVGDWQVL